MVFFEPFNNPALEFFDEVNQFHCTILSNLAYILIFEGISFGPTSLQKLGVLGMTLPKD
jgi:hypothetical protein